MTSYFQLLTSTDPAAIAVVRLVGDRAHEFVSLHVRPRRATARLDQPGAVHRADLIDDGAPIDDILVSVHRAPPHADIRLHLHGGPWIVQRCTRLALAAGLAQRDGPVGGLWRSQDAIQAEACALLPAMSTRQGARWLLHQARTLPQALRQIAASPVERAAAHCREIASRARIVDWFSRPRRIALVGPPNAGKSTLANGLAGQPVSLVSDRPGTTRDWIEVPGELDGFPVQWLDTAGVRAADAAIEADAIHRTAQMVQEADAAVVVLDGSDPQSWNLDGLDAALGLHSPACVVLNKSDLVSEPLAVIDRLPPSWRQRAVSVAAIRGDGIREMLATIIANVFGEIDLHAPAAFTSRHVQTLERMATQADSASIVSGVAELIEAQSPL